MALLEVDNLRQVYPNGHEALKQVSFRADAGEIVAVIGRSGAGKSTLLRCINGLEPVTSGEIVVDGKSVTRLDKKELGRLRRRIGFVWQEFNLVDRLPVLTNVLSGRLGYKGVLAGAFGYFDQSERELAVHNLERVNLLHRASQRADKLSGGEKQRTAIARAMTQKPRILLADEPVASLDPELAATVLSDLARIAREDGVLALINIHQIELARLFCDRILGLAQGRVVFDGPPSDMSEDVLDAIYRFDRPVLQTQKG